jgi:HTH-type transcriptional regulator / antitoxin HipB
MIAKTPREIGLLLRERRRQLGLDQQELAKRAGTSRQWIIEVEKGKARAEVGLVMRALAVLGLSLDVRPSEPRRAHDQAAPPFDLDAVIERARHVDAPAVPEKGGRVGASGKAPPPRPPLKSSHARIKRVGK